VTVQPSSDTLASVRAVVDRVAPALLPGTRVLISGAIVGALNSLAEGGSLAEESALKHPSPTLEPELAQQLEPTLDAIRLEIERAMSTWAKHAAATLMGVVIAVLVIVSRSLQAPGAGGSH
jgi:hypothetical protein